MTASLRIAIADDEPDMRDYFRKSLPRLGHQVVGVAHNGRELVECCRANHPDLVITDIKMPDMDGIDAAVQIYRDRPVPIIIVSAHHDPTLVARAEADHVMGYLVKPIELADLEPMIALVVRRFQQFEVLRQEAADMRQALADHKVIVRAKGVLMKRCSIDEESAFGRIQSLASEENRKVIDIAQMIVIAEKAFQPSAKA
jgi:two-component system, response regulator PdtaR